MNTMDHNHTQSPSHDRPIPASGVLYFAKIGSLTLEFDHAKVTGKEILVAAKKAPVDEYDLYQYFADGRRVKIGLDDFVDLSVEGVEQFKIIGKKNTDGLMRESAFTLPERETKILNSLGLDWSTRKDQGRNVLTIFQYQLPPGYNQKVADISFILPANFPESQIDMAYFYPALTRSDGVTLRSTTVAGFFGLSWQQWSRHRTPENPWRSGEDDIGTHLAYMESWLYAELKRGHQ